MPAHLIAQEGPYSGLVLNLEDGEEWVIGRDPDAADLIIEDSTVSRRHVRLTKTEEGVYLKNLSRVNPTLVNGKELEERALLKEGDTVQVGNTLFLFSEENIPDLTPPPQKAQEKNLGKYDDIFGDLEEDKEPSLEENPPPPDSPEESGLEEEPAQEELFEEEEANLAPKSSAYDTIFEESGEEEPLPFNFLAEESPLILKVISGPNAGAEIGIEKGRSYTIGKDPNASDIVFQDLSVSRHHAALSVSADGRIEIEDLSSKNGTLVNGVAITEKKEISPQDIISLGTTVFLIIDREAPQETIYSPMAPSYETAKAEEKKEAEEQEAVAAKVEEPPPADWRRQIIPTKHLILGGALAFTFLVAFLSFFSLFKSKGIEIAKVEPAKEIKQSLEKFPAVQYSYNPGSGKLFLVGHVLTAVDYAEMRYRIDQLAGVMSVEDTVVIDEYVWKSMNDVLSANANWKGVTISAPSPGKFVVSGYLNTSQEAALLSDYLTVNFPYLDRLENRVVAEESLTLELQAMLQEARLGAVSLQLANGDVTLSGRYSEEKSHEMEKLIKEIGRVPGVLKVRSYALAGGANLAAIDISQNYQVGGSSLFDGRGYSVVLNGRIYTLGDFVDGMRITEIEPATILLEKDSTKYKIDYTR